MQHQQNYALYEIVKNSFVDQRRKVQKITSLSSLKFRINNDDQSSRVYFTAFSNFTDRGSSLYISDVRFILFCEFGDPWPTHRRTAY